MQLFSPQKAKEAHNQRRDDDIAQVAYLTVTLKKLQDRINEENENFSARMKEQRTLYTEEKSKLQIELTSLQQKIKKGERRLTEILKPVNGLKEQAEELLRKAEARANEARRQEEDVKELGERFTNKLDNITDRETQLIQNELKIKAQLKGIEEESKMISDSHTALNSNIAEFEINKTAKLKELEELKNALTVKTKRIEEYLETRTKELDEREIRLKDRERTVERNYKRLSNNN